MLSGTIQQTWEINRIKYAPFETSKTYPCEDTGPWINKISRCLPLTKSKRTHLRAWKIYPGKKSTYNPFSTSRIAAEPSTLTPATRSQERVEKEPLAADPTSTPHPSIILRV